MKTHLKRLRKAAGLTQAQMASRLGVEQNTYGTWERGATNIYLEHARDCAQVLGCTIDEIAGYSASNAGGQQTAELLESFRALNDEGRTFLLTAAKAATKNPKLVIELSES